MIEKNQNQDHILIVDDDHEIRELLGEYLQKNGMRTQSVADGRQMREAMSKARFDLVILDLMMPGEDGLTICRNLRAQSNIPILMLTARGEDMDKIIGIEMGADDYLGKPFQPRELFARLRAILRRTRAMPPPDADHALPAAQRLVFEDWQLDTSARHLIDKDNNVTPLTGAEYRLMSILLSYPQRVLSRDQLMELTQGRENEVFERSIDILISRLRAHLGDDARKQKLIKTVRGVGYILTAQVGQQALEN